MRRVSMIFYSENHGNDNAARRCLSDKTKWFYQIIVLEYARGETDEKTDPIAFYLAAVRLRRRA